MQYRSFPSLHCAVVFSALCGIAGLPGYLTAQERYDDHAIDDRVYLVIGGYKAVNIDSQIQVNARGLGVGTIIDFEDLLNVENTISTARLDGHLRFGRAHRLEWTWFTEDRSGLVQLNNDVVVGDVVFPLSYQVQTLWDYRVVKLGYAWSFINTERYEFYVGGGLNVRRVSLAMRGESAVAGSADTRVFDETGDLPLPTVAVGMRYSITERLDLKLRSESFALEIGDSSGRWQDSYALVDYRIGDRFGVGGGINLSNISLKTDVDERNVMESDSSHVGLMVFMSARF
jgi:hypothetical protein